MPLLAPSTDAQPVPAGTLTLTVPDDALTLSVPDARLELT